MGSEEIRDFQAQVNIEEDDYSPSNAFVSRNRCCFYFPCFGSPSAARLTASAAPSSSSTPSSFWARFHSADSENRWWARPIRAFNKLREWSEIVAGPKWKTFIRRFNRHNNRRHPSPGKFQYDELSYALNFDDGPAAQAQEEYDHFPDFSSRFASIPLSAKSSMDLGRGAPAG